MNGANASYVNVNIAADVLYMRIDSHVICKWNLRSFAVVENDMTLCPNEREVQLIRTYKKIFSFFIVQLLFDFNHPIFHIISYVKNWIPQKKCWGRIEVSIWMSSANKWTLKEHCLIRLESVVYKERTNVKKKMPKKHFSLAWYISWSLLKINTESMVSLSGTKPNWISFIHSLFHKVLFPTPFSTHSFNAQEAL